MECQIYYDYIMNMCYCLTPEYYEFAFKLIPIYQGLA